MSHEKKKIILDTSVILNLFERVATKKENLQELLFERFDIYTTPKVIEEATRSNKSNLTTDFMESVVCSISPDFNSIDPELFSEMNEKLDEGEVEVITCCLNSGYLSSIDDLGAIKYGRKLGITNLGTIVLLKIAFDNGTINSADVSSMISEMRQNGAYFKEMKDKDFEAYYKKYLK